MFELFPRRSDVAWVCGTILFFVIAWLVILFLRQSYPGWKDDLGTFGDSFGVVTCLFTGLSIVLLYRTLTNEIESSRHGKFLSTLSTYYEMYSLNEMKQISEIDEVFGMLQKLSPEDSVNLAGKMHSVSENLLKAREYKLKKTLTEYILDQYIQNKYMPKSGTFIRVEKKDMIIDWKKDIETVLRTWDFHIHHASNPYYQEIAMASLSAKSISLVKLGYESTKGEYDSSFSKTLEEITIKALEVIESQKNKGVSFLQFIESFRELHNQLKDAFVKLEQDQAL